MPTHLTDKVHQLMGHGFKIIGEPYVQDDRVRGLPVADQIMLWAMRFQVRDEPPHGVHGHLGDCSATGQIVVPCAIRNRWLVDLQDRYGVVHGLSVQPDKAGADEEENRHDDLAEESTDPVHWIPVLPDRDSRF